MNDFFELSDRLRSEMPTRLKIECSRYTDLCWCITVAMNKCFEKVYARLKKWADEVKEYI